ncbi:MAG TPA: FGGY family carbohydrate kinase [Pseudonocardia sp.]|nr:FGGY family carbohydrate kinase [Pseudonocardia sp.]
MAELLLGIDLGTTSTKAVLVHPVRGVVAEQSRPVALHSDHVGHAEADPAVWWRNVGALVPALLAEARVPAGEVAGVATSGMVPAVLPLDSLGRPLRRAILQNDARAGAEIADIAAKLGDLDVAARTGSALTQQSVAPTLAWLSRHEPDTHAATATVAGSYDWLARALGARPHVERNWAMESGLYELDGRPFVPMFEAGGVEERLLPEVVDPGGRVGEVSAEAAAHTGLVAGTPILVGGADHVLSAFAAGLREPGDWLVKLGGGGDILAVTETAFVDRRLYLDAHPAPGLWLPNGCMSTSGSLVRWLATLTGEEDLVSLGERAATRRPGEVLCLPYFLGEKSPLHDPDLRGAFVGLDLAHDSADLFRAVLEAVAFGFRHHVDVFTERGVPLGGAPRVTNGGAGSPIWKQIHADVLGRPVVPVLRHPGASLGAALAAGVGVGLLAGWHARADYLRLGEPVLPDPDRVARYDDAYRTWRQLGEALAPISHTLADRSRT